MSSPASWPSKTFNATSASLSALDLDLSAFVHPTTLSTMSVVVRAEKQSFVDALEASEAGAELRVRGPQWYWNPFGALSTAYLIDVYVPTNTLARLSLSGCGDVAVAPRVLVNTTTQALAVAVSGSGAVFVEDVALVLRQLSVSVSGSGRAQLHVPVAQVAADIELSASGSGTVALVGATVDAAAVTTSVSGSGAVYLGASSVVRVAGPVSTTVSGSGDVHYYSAGSCKTHDVSVSGSGVAATGALACASDTVRVSGSGTAYVQATARVDATVSGSGSVVLVGAMPASVSGAVASGANKVSTYSLKPVPGYGPSTVYQFGVGWSVICLVVLIALCVTGIAKCRKAGWCTKGCCCKKRHASLDHDAAPVPIVVVPAEPLHEEAFSKIATPKTV